MQNFKKKLMVYYGLTGRVKHFFLSDLSSILQQDDLLVLNESTKHKNLLEEKTEDTQTEDSFSSSPEPETETDVAEAD